MWFKTDVSEEDLNTSIKLLNLSEDPEFIEKVRRNNLDIIEASNNFEKEEDENDFADN
jgi:hypothetical protein